MFRSNIRHAAKAINNKQSTNIYGLMVEPYALDKLPNVLSRTLNQLAKFPADSHYAQVMTRYTNEQLKLVESSECVPSYEAKTGTQIEEVLQQARFELNLSEELIKYQIWEPLVEEPPKEQWVWP